MKLIKLQDKFILVSNEDAKNNELLYNIENNTICRAMGDAEVSHFKIIAGIPELPSIDFSLLSKEDGKRIEYVDVEKLAMDKTRNLAYGGVTASRSAECFIWKHGFKTAQSLNDKMFSLDDIRSIIKWLNENYSKIEDELAKPFQDESKDLPDDFFESAYETALDKAIQSIQKTSWDVDVEMEDVFTKNEENYVHHTGAKGNYSTHNKQPKITNNSIKVIRIL